MKTLLTALILGWLGSSVRISAAVLILNPTGDSRLRSQAANTPDGSGTQFSVYNVGANIQKSVVRFDLSAIPTGSTINSATLVLQRDSALWTGGDLGFNTYIFRVTNSWTEAAVTWNDRFGGNPWATPGGDYVGTTGAQDVSPYASGTLGIANGTPGVFPLSFNVATLASQWVNGVYSNYGFEITSDVGNQLAFGSKEHTPSTLWPALNIDYTAPIPEPSVALLLGLGGMILRYARQKKN